MRLRLSMLALVLFAQTFFFLVLVKQPISVEGDNPRYELAGWNLATGHGYSLPLTGYGGTDDPQIYDWVCSRHAHACLPDTTHPIAVYMPGYSILIAAIYGLVGRSLLAICAMHLVLLWALFVVFEQLAVRLLPRVGYLFAMAAAVTYPFLARQATIIMADHLHAVLWLAAFAVFMLMRHGPARGAIFGGLMAAATLCRPYSLFVFPILWGLALVWRTVRLSRQEWWAGALAFILPFAVWTARNEYWYGRFLPLTTGGPGALLYQASLEWEVDLSDPARGHEWYVETTRRFGDVQSRRGSQLQMAEALSRIREHPWKYIERVLIHVPKLWISMASRVWFLPLTYLGGLLVMGVAGAWSVRRDERFVPLIIAIAVNWAFLLPFAGEARRTLPLRLPMLLLAGAYASTLAEYLRRRRSHETPQMARDQAGSS
jgi:hypothetical protein